MMSLTIFCALAALTEPPYIPTPTKHMDTRLWQLCQNDVRNDPKQLAKALDEIWKMLSEISPERDRLVEDQLQTLVCFITIKSPIADKREGMVGRETGMPVYSMLLHIGLPAVPVLLEQLVIIPDQTKNEHNHRERIVLCLVEIYEKGGDGRRMATERIKMYAEEQKPELKKRILAALDHIPKPVKLPPGK